MPNPFSSVIAIDPGASGAAVIRHVGSSVDPTDVHKFNNDTTIAALASHVRHYKVNGWMSPVVVIEKVWASPAMGVSSSFAFGDNFGGWRLAMKAVGLEVYGVTPQEWSRVVCPQIDSKLAQRKRDLRDLAAAKFPNVRVNLTNCDALLISEFAVNRLQAGLCPGTLL